ncbi:MAG TPA: CrcB family protein, partial [Mycobacteriales bacterium]|nr:CrcB family protein [Mycobacteriales bacterium]
MTLLAIAVSGAAGAVARYLVDDAVSRRARTPAGTSVVNITGCLLLGLVAGRVTGDARAVLGTGFLGAYTTFSAYAVQVVELAGADRTKAAIYAIASLVAGSTAAAAGLAA